MMAKKDREAAKNVVEKTEPEPEDGKEEIDVDEDDGKLQNDLKRELNNIENLKEQLAQTNADKELWMNKYYGELADVQNLRKQIARDNETALKYRSMPFVEKLIPFLNSLDMAFRSEPQDKAAKGWVEGIHMVYKQLLHALQEEGVQELNPKKGDKFDPQTMQAFKAVPAKKPDLVEEVLMKGYLLKDRLVSPASVAVTVARENATDDTKGEDADEKEKPAQ